MLHMAVYIIRELCISAKLPEFEATFIVWQQIQTRTLNKFWAPSCGLIAAEAHSLPLLFWRYLAPLGCHGDLLPVGRGQLTTALFGVIRRWGLLQIIALEDRH